MTKNLLLSLAMLFALSINAQMAPCSDLFFSEYVEGWSQNKAVEIYNPTNNTIDLSNYKVERYSNGATNSSAGGITTLTGMLAPGDAFVLTNGETDTSSTFGFCDPMLISLGDMAEPNGSYPTPMHMNGNDAIVLTGPAGIIDVIGKVGEDPASGAWTCDIASGFTLGTWWTAQHTLRRKATVEMGDYNGVDLFNPTVEWDSLPVGTWGGLGSHVCDCHSPAAINEKDEISYLIYPNPANRGEVINITTTGNIESVDVINILGKEVLSQNLNKIHTSHLSRGTYIVRINLNDGTILENKIILE